jgi:PA14 domain
MEPIAAVSSLVGFSFQLSPHLFSARCQEVSVMRSLFRTFSLVLICLLLIASSDAAVNMYGHRVGLSLAAAQGTSIVTVNLRAYQTPNSANDLAFTSPSPLGHGLDNVEAQSNGQNIQGKSCKWFSFHPVSGQIVRITLKFDWYVTGELSTSAPDWESFAEASGFFEIYYTTDNGSTFTNAIQRGEGSHMYRPGDETKPFGDSGSFSVDLPVNTPINQIIVYDALSVFTDVGGAGSANARADASISSIRLEVETLNCPASVATDRWKGEFYNNTNLSGIPTTVRDDGAGFLSFNFGDGNPPAGTCGLTDDNFSARWKRMINFPRGLYKFTVTADDGVRLYVDGQLRIDKWFDQGATTYTADVFLSAGNHEVKLEYYEHSGGALISLNWTTLVNCVAASVPADRWKGEYYNGVTLSGDLMMVRDDGDGFPDFNFGNGGPGSVCAQVVDNFSARWTRMVNFAAGTYRFVATVDNGVRLYVDGQSKIDQWGNLPPNTYTTDVSLSAGTHEIKLEFVEYSGDASVGLFWVDVNCLANVPANRWRGEYFNKITPSGYPWMARDDGDGFLNFDFGLGSPSAACGLGVDNFSARWTRTINFMGGIYRFSVTGDDGVKLYIDGQVKIDKWFTQGATTYTADATLSAAPHEIKLEYFEGGGPGVARLSWTLVTGLSCLPDVPIIGAVPGTSEGGSIATTAILHAPKGCGQKKSE